MLFGLSNNHVKLEMLITAVIVQMGKFSSACSMFEEEINSLAKDMQRGKGGQQSQPVTTCIH